jgi:hypothetical protein
LHILQSLCSLVSDEDLKKKWTDNLNQTGTGSFLGCSLSKFIGWDCQATSMAAVTINRT